MEEFDIGREVSPYCYMLYKLIKSYEGITTPEIIEELGVSRAMVQTNLKKLELSNVVISEKSKGKKTYRTIRSKEWRLN